MKPLTLASIISNAISAVADIFVLHCYYALPIPKKLSYEMVRNVAIGDFIMAIGNSFPAKNIDFLCILQGIFTTFGGVCSFLWVGFIAYVMHSINYTDIWTNNAEKNIQKQEKFKRIMYIIGYGVYLFIFFFFSSKLLLNQN